MLGFVADRGTRHKAAMQDRPHARQRFSAGNIAIFAPAIAPAWHIENNQNRNFEIGFCSFFPVMRF
jgi:hypothetical protein